MKDFTLTSRQSKLEDCIFRNKKLKREFFVVYDSFYTGEFLDEIEYMEYHGERLKRSLKVMEKKFKWLTKKKKWIIRSP